MYSSQSPGFTAEFIKEEPGKPVPQKPVRRRGLNDQIKWVKAWMSKLPQGDEDWDNNRPSTPEDILRLRDRLTISHVKSRRDMDWLTLLETYAAASKDFEGRETQLHCMVMVAACHVAHDQGLTINEVMDAMAKCVTGGSDTLRSKRFALPKCVQIGDELAKVLGPRAYELPLRVNSYFTFGQHFTVECFPILRRESAFAHRPNNKLPSELLRIPSLVCDLCDGKSATNRKGSRARRCEGEGEIEVTDEVEGKVDGQPRQHLEYRFEHGYGT
ncbi:uncharacterized protein BKA55DRAFT_500080 [Fusarium redolens]|uniref:Uncharacterized protein n=1 Tax=Fusarium redolens TaxID=48865 RepID=A0A9P9KR92_FUSRE|nr:uncharacterized protein BKA55DRAFT_500080 [Fusarium redolens]KAH7267027.1 hypothetical protein BKA55DRAFT_500080 [Fusarium redolens]